MKVIVYKSYDKKLAEEEEHDLHYSDHEATHEEALKVILGLQEKIEKLEDRLDELEMEKK